MKKGRSAKVGDDVPAIQLVGVSTHNLKGIDVSIPLERMTVVTGVSGSGKSSLAFDTLYAEGQRRYVETFSAYSRQFLPPFERPAVERVARVPPSVAVSQHRVSGDTTVASASGLMDYLRAVYVHSAHLVCPTCDIPVRAAHPEVAFTEFLAEARGEFAAVQVVLELSAISQWTDWRTECRQRGFLRVMIGNELFRTDAEPPPPPAKGTPLRLVIDRIKLDESQQARWIEAIESAYREGNGSAEIVVKQATHLLFDRPKCPHCFREFPPADISLFSPTHEESACPTCHGAGMVGQWDRGKIFPDQKKSIRQGGIAPLATPAFAEVQRSLIAALQRAGIATDVPFEQLPRTEQDRLWEGDSDRDWTGLESFLNGWASSKHRHGRAALRRFQTHAPCRACHGGRFRAEVLAYRWLGCSLVDFLRLTIDQAHALVDKEQALEQTAAGKSIHSDILSRLSYLKDVGLGYLTLDRPARSLSGGESRRVALGTALGSRLAQTLFVLDEPTAGLHPEDTVRLLSAIRSLMENRNTAVLVEHDPQVIAEADWLIDLGPGAGPKGGELLFQGSPDEIDRTTSLTGLYLHSRPTLAETKRLPRGKLVARGAHRNNLRQVDVTLPLGQLVVFVGVSGAGKSSLVTETLYPALVDRLPDGSFPAGEFASLELEGVLGEVVLMEESSLARHARAIPASYLGFIDAIRDLFAHTSEAKIRGLEKGAFSFNRPGGRCETCEGLGTIRYDMQFLPEIRLRCDACQGRRFQPKVLEVKYRGRAIDEVLALPASDAFSFFRGERQLQFRLKVLKDVGLGYLPIGQPLDLLSGGERQRLKLASYVSVRTTTPCLFILEEPTTGLHPADIPSLIETLSSLLDAGHSVWVIEHSLPFIAVADHVVELGPGGGPEGGSLLASCSPADLTELDTPTGRALRAAIRGGI